MKKINYLIAVSILITMAGCSNDLNTLESNKEGALTINAGINEDAASRLSFAEDESAVTVNWEAVDVLNLYAGSISADTKSVSTLTQVAADAHKCNFVFDGYNGTSDAATPLYAYVKRSGITFDDATAVATINMASQGGTLANAANYDLLSATGVYGTGKHIALDFAHKMAFVKVIMNIEGVSPVEVTAPGTTTNNATNITLAGTGLYSAVNLNMADCSFKEGTAGNVVANSAAITDGVATAYMCVYPSAITNGKISFTVQGKTYEYNIGDKTLSAKKMYTLSVSLVKTHITDAVWSEETDIPVLASDQMTVSEKAADWMTTASSNGLVKPNVAVNDNEFPRQGTITVTSSTGRTKAIIDISQYEIKDFDGDEWNYTGTYRTPLNSSSATTGTLPCIFTVDKDTEGQPTGTMRISGLFTDGGDAYQLVTNYKDTYFNLPFQIVRTYKSTGEIDKMQYAYSGTNYYLAAMGYGTTETGTTNYYVAATHANYRLDANIVVNDYTVTLNFADDINFNYKFTRLLFALMKSGYIGSSSSAKIYLRSYETPMSITKTLNP